MIASELMNYKNWAVIGDILNSEKYAYKILNALEESKYNVVGINPRGNKEQVYTKLQDVTFKIDVLDLCINPLSGIEIVKEAKSLNIDKVLIQPGAGSEEILEYCRDNGIIAIEGCALIELSNL